MLPYIAYMDPMGIEPRYIAVVFWGFETAKMMSQSVWYVPSNLIDVLDHVQRIARNLTFLEPEHLMIEALPCWIG